jgi:hypothetical protein
MNSGIAALLGVTLGFIFSIGADLVRQYVAGRRFASAIRAELAEAKDLIYGKMRWVLRNEKGVDVSPGTKRVAGHQIAWTWNPTPPPKECSPCERLLYLGEPEEFVVSLPFWEQHVLAIVERIPAPTFAQFRREVGLVNRFVSKFGEMKMSFTTDLGNAAWMATACLNDLITIHDELNPEKAPILCLLQKEEAARVIAANRRGE